jgi:hypothetical protein
MDDEGELAEVAQQILAAPGDVTERLTNASSTLPR